MNTPDRFTAYALQTSAGAEVNNLPRTVDHNEKYYRLWTSPNGVDHLVNRRTSGCMTCGRRHEEVA